MQNTRFQLGDSRPPGPGRPKGSVTQKTQVKRIQEVLKPYVPELIERNLESALKGDALAASSLLNLYGATLNQPG